MPFALFPLVAAQATLAVLLMSGSALTGRRRSDAPRLAFTVEMQGL